VQISIATKIAPNMEPPRKEQQPKFHRRCSPMEDVGPCLVPGTASIDIVRTDSRAAYHTYLGQDISTCTPSASRVRRTDESSIPLPIETGFNAGVHERNRFRVLSPETGKG
jgi:hypothetical protein